MESLYLGTEKNKTKLKSLNNPKIIFEILKIAPKGSRARQGLFGFLRAMLNKAVKWEFIAENPCNKIDPPKYEAGENEIYTLSDLEKMFDCLSREPLKYQVAVSLAASRGYRRCEIVGIKISDIDFDSGILKIRHDAVRVKKIGMIIRTTKTKKSKRDLPLPSNLLELIKTLCAEVNEHKVMLGNKWEGEDYLFIQWDGKVMSSDSLSRWWKEFCKNNGLKFIKFKNLRHTTASLMIANNKTDIVSVSGILGHSRVSTTLNIYAQLIKETQIKSLNAYDNLISKKGK